MGAGRLALRRAGSTSTCKIKNPANPKDAVVEFQQGIWRYHPKTKRFELFSEGGGNTYGLDFDKHGQRIAGTNWGGFAMLHQVQGAYYVKGFAKHGPLHNPHTYGYFDHVPYTGFKGGHVTCGGIVYQADAYPKEFRDQYIAGEPAVERRLLAQARAGRSRSFKASHGGDLLEANDTWFRPVDLLLGPGRVRLRRRLVRQAGRPPRPGRQLGQDQRPHLPDRVQGRAEARAVRPAEEDDRRAGGAAEAPEQVVAERGPAAARASGRTRASTPKLRKWLLTEKGQLALEALWALYASGGWIERDFDSVG